MNDDIDLDYSYKRNGLFLLQKLFIYEIFEI